MDERQNTMDADVHRHTRSPLDWLYLQMIKQRDDIGHFAGVKLKAIFGSIIPNHCERFYREVSTEITYAL